MQGTVGHWCAIVVLGLAAAYGIGSFFNQQVEYENMRESLKKSDPAELATNGNAAVGNLLVQRQGLENEVKKYKSVTIPDLQRNLSSAQAELLAERDRAKESEREYQKQVEANKILKKETEKLRKDVEIARQGDKDLEKQRERYKRQAQEYMKISEDLDRDKKKLEANKAALTGSALKRIRALQREKSVLLEAINKKAEVIRRRSSSVKNEADGNIIALDVANRFCVINLGSINNVHRGMRFNVIRWRKNRWDKIGTVEVNKVGPSTSEAIIIEKPPVKKVCPQTGYVARDPEERYSPYVSGENNSVVPLIAVTQSDVVSMSAADPIIKGDSISNPFFDKNKKLKFAFAGEPVLEHSIEVLKNQIQEAGAIMQDNIDIDTDFLVLGRVEENTASENGEASENANKNVESFQKTMEIANRYGIPIIREVELYDFLRN